MSNETRITKLASFYPTACASFSSSFSLLHLITRRMSLSKCGGDTSSKACIFAISSAILPVQELLGVRHAASGSAATNPRGTIKLHLNNVSGRDGVVMRSEGGRKEKGEKHGGGIRAASLRKKARSEWIVARRLKRGTSLGRT